MITEQRTGRQVPTREVYDPGLPSFYDRPQVKAALNRWGLSPFPWQDHVLRASLSVKGSGLFYRNVGLSVPRQNGKSAIIEARIFIGLIFLSEKMVYTSYRTDSSDAIFERVMDVIEGGAAELKAYFPVLPSKKAKDKIIQARDPKTGELLGRVRFTTRKGGGGRGKSEIIIFLDEAQDLTAGENDALTAGVATFKNGQVWYVGTPEPAESASTIGGTARTYNGLGFFAQVRKSMLDGAPGACWMEWGADKLPQRTDRAAWYEANPSLGLVMGEGRGITEEFLESRTSSDESFAVEHLGWWSSQDRAAAIEASRWHDLEVTKEEVEKDFARGRVSLAVKSSIDEAEISVVLASRRGNGDIFLELQNTLDGTRAWEDELWPLLEKYLKSSKCTSIIIDGPAASSQLRARLEAAGRWKSAGNKFSQGKVRFASTSEVANACALLVGVVNERRVFHGGQGPVDAAVADAGKRPFRNGGYGFASLSGRTSSTLVEAMALALQEASKSRVNEALTEKEKASNAFAKSYRPLFG